ncbi:hypothetical protein DSL72_008145 [Monilinia vaccinii-corymbosi]|uniref:Zn(2)-C6 fungal-type domain-containing protein n=1 Tax=Monilinia vaccinii-corymbosi TaxID=61207 RepID=A0A8A3PK47_9HELO|nr:hypothetical protein DSL72_008145 [Monilinia vaccinii-corymbosi]
MATSNKDTPRCDNRDTSISIIQSYANLPSRQASATEKTENAAQKKTIKFRAKLPKVRTGCQNCKIRRIKCDEAAPGCARCFKFGIPCSGYLKQSDKPKPRPIVPILPKEEEPRATRKSIVELYIGPRFTDELEARYFRYFCQNSAAEIAGPLPTGIWSEIIPQVCEIEPYIAHGLVALGAFIKHRKEITNGSVSSSTHQHREYALREYGKSLRGMQEAIDKNTGRSPRTALIACMLVFCIEGIQGHQASATLHATNGILMMYDLYQANMARCALGNQCAAGPELRRAFMDLDLQVLYCLDIRPTAHHVMIKEQLNQHLRGELLPFQNITDCHEHLQAIMRRNLHFINVARKSQLGLDFQERYDKNFQPRDWEGAADLRQYNYPWSRVIHKVGFPPGLLYERDTYLAEMIRWEEASKDIFQQCMSSPPHSDAFRTAALLKAHAAASAIKLHGSFYTNDIGYDQLQPYFRTIITNCALVHPYYSSSSYHTNLGILMPLFEVGLHCRDKILRDQAIAMSFVNKEYREGVWDSYVGGSICKWIRDLEEPWRDADGFMPHDMRAKLAGLNVVAEKRMAQIFCTQRAAPGLGSVTKEIVITW